MEMGERIKELRILNRLTQEEFAANLKTASGKGGSYMYQSIEIATAEAKDKLVLEYLDLCLKYMAWDITREQKSVIKIRLNEIRKDLNMELI